MEKTCRLLNYTPKDIICSEPDKNNALPANHALTELQRQRLSEMKKILSSLSFEKIKELAKQVKESSGLDCAVMKITV